MKVENEYVIYFYKEVVKRIIGLEDIFCGYLLVKYVIGMEVWILMLLFLYLNFNFIWYRYKNIKLSMYICNCVFVDKFVK